MMEQVQARGSRRRWDEGVLKCLVEAGWVPAWVPVVLIRRMLMLWKSGRVLS